MPLPLGPAALAALRIISGAKIVRTTGGIVGTNAKTVNPVYRNVTVKPAPKTQAQINQEGLAKIRKELNIPEKGTAAHQRRMSSKASKENVSLMQSRIKRKG